MAGAVKHMERSRRSHRTNENVFMQFHRNAYRVAQVKENNKTMGQKLSSIFRKMIPAQEEK